jgi:hypothetical protein
MKFDCDTFFWLRVVKEGEEQTTARKIGHASGKIFKIALPHGSDSHLKLVTICTRFETERAC